VKLCQNFRRHFCYVHLTRNAVDSVAQHQHLSKTESEPSTLDPPTAYSSKRIFPFFNRLSRDPKARTSWHPKCPSPSCLLGSVERGVANKMFFKARRVHIGLKLRPITLTVTHESEALSIAQPYSALGGGWQE
jgi:hypothetical protein